MKAFFVLLLVSNLFGAPIGVNQRSDLDFGSAPSGDLAKTVVPGSVENAENASFQVRGTKNTAYTIILPASGQMITGAGASPNEIIALSSFQSTPAEGANGMLDNAGKEDLFVGATRAAIPFTQVPGAYIGTFTVEVIY